MTKTKHFLDLKDIEALELKNILALAKKLKSEKFNPPQLLKGHSLAMMFDKRSTRTRISFELAMKQLGGHTVVMDMAGMQITGSESPEHTAKVLERFVDGVMIRMSDHELLCDLANHSNVPYINGLTDHSHPCQIMADLLTIKEHKGQIEDLKIAWFGDFNNVATSYAQASEHFNFDMTFAVPEDQASAVKATSKDVHFQPDPKLAAKDADVIVTDTWVSMGQEGKAINKFGHLQVNSELMAHAKDNAIFMHCMPIHKGEEVTQDVLQSKACVIFDEAENRLHAQKAILAWCMSDSGVEINN